MEVCMKVSLNNLKKMALEESYGIKEIIMKGIGKQIRSMDMENVDILMELFKKGNGNILLLKENYRKSIIFKI